MAHCASWVRMLTRHVWGRWPEIRFSFQEYSTCMWKDRDVCLWQLFQTKNLGNLSE